MAARVNLILGPALCGKTTQLLARYRAVLRERRLGQTLWLAPTQRGAFDIRGRLLDATLDACFTPGVMTFAQFAESVLQASASPIRPVTPAMKRHLVRRILVEALAGGRLSTFAPIATTPGLVDLVSQWIGELKRLEIWPDEFRRVCQKRGLTPKDVELLSLYEVYQEALTKHDLYDAEGRFWWARHLLQSGQTRPFEYLRLVVVDGFTDFTHTQHEILQILAQRVEEVYFSLPLEQQTRRTDLFAKTQETLDELTRRHPSIETQWLPRATSSAFRALAHLQRQVFKSPREAEAARDCDGVSILAASRDYGEVLQIGRQIKELLTTGNQSSGGQPVKPGEVAVVFRRLQESAPLVREVFDELGLPFSIEADEALDASPALAALVNLLQLDGEDWPFRRLLAGLGNSYFRPAWPEWDRGRRLAVVERTIRQLQLPDGREALLRRVKWTAETTPEADSSFDADRFERLQRRQQEAALALPLLQRLAAVFDQLPEQATPSAWVEALTRLADETGFSQVIASPIDLDRPASEVAAWDRLRQALESAEQLALWLGDEPPQWDRRLLVQNILDILRGEQLPAPHDETGRVRVLSAASIRTLSVPYLFFAGLSESAMPGPDRQDRLYSDAEYAQLRDLGLPVILRSHRSQEEMLLFYEVATRATRFLQFSYPALDDKAQPLLPSPFVAEVAAAMGPQLQRRVTADLSPLPQASEPQSAEDFRLMSVARGLEGDCRLLAALVRQPPSPQVGQQLLAGLQLTGERARRNQFGPFEGLLQSPAATAWLAERFGPERRFSPSHLEQYATCPYRFFLAHVLRLQELTDLGLEVNFAQRGGRLHDVLAALHRRMNQLQGRPLSPARLAEAEYLRHLAQSLDERLTLAADEYSLERAMVEIDRSTLNLWLARYHEQHRQYDGRAQGLDASPAPAFFEVSFGLPLAGDVDPISREQPLEITVDGVTVKLAGRIDRIDLGQASGRPIFSVVDYKSGRARTPPKDRTLDGTSLQLELYTVAAEELLLADRAAVPWEAGYWFLREKGYRAWFELHELSERGPAFSDAWSALRREVQRKVAALVSGIRAAQFPVYSLDEKCTGFCPFNTVCRINQVRSLEKTWPPDSESARLALNRAD